MQWNLEKLYETSVQGLKVPKPNRLKILGEDVALYRKDGEDFTLVGNVDNDFYNTTLSKYIKLGSKDSVELRSIVSKRLAQSNSVEKKNIDYFQGYIQEGGFKLSEDSVTRSEQFLIQCIENDTGIFLSDFLSHSYGSNIDTYNSYFKETWEAIPREAKMGRAGEGELFLAFFCNGRKPTTGDLEVNNRQIEVKGFGGRLYKKSIDITRGDEILASIDHSNEEKLIQRLVDAIGIYAGSDSYKSQILDLINSNNDILNELINNLQFFQASLKTRPKGRFPDLSMFIKIAGMIQMLEYKNQLKFDSMITFKKTPAGLWLQFINFANISNINELRNKLNSLPSKINVAKNVDGNGYSLEVSPLKR